MPIVLPAFSRRRFLVQALGAAMLRPDRMVAAQGATEGVWALFSDTHIAADKARIVKEAHMAANLERCVSEVLALSSRPAGVIVSGDCALLDGQAGDYETFAGLIRPLREGGMPVHLLMGNHDDRTHAVTAFSKESASPAPLENRHVTVIEDDFVNWFLLDSLDKVNKTPGVLGETQLAWLGKELDARPDIPAIIVVHHNVVLIPHEMSLQDSMQLLAVLRPRAQVKAAIFGHMHRWENKEDESGIHLISMPPTAYIFGAGFPNGWVQAKTRKGRLKLELRSLDTQHPQHGEVKELKWRGAD